MIIDVKPSRLESTVIMDVPFDKGKELLEKKGYRIISLKENAELHLSQGYYKPAIQGASANLVREGLIYLTPNKLFLTKNSPIMEHTKKAMQSARKHIKYDVPTYYLTDEETERALSNSVKHTSKTIPTTRFKDNELTSFAFEDLAEDYGLFLKDSGIDGMFFSSAGFSMIPKPLIHLIYFTHWSKADSIPHIVKTYPKKVEAVENADLLRDFVEGTKYVIDPSKTKRILTLYPYEIDEVKSCTLRGIKYMKGK